ncbi:hypothetical protein [Rhizobium leguminosarum]|uniref:hypothetical protein n=1 Tax=Rhizobium leguminosarum TaxID=384 RepID=UPI001C9288F2|nr:hypothetical protein [Rhizobium leguminosarum]MBY3027479.1 hypothetical protein [Rhizobium leguminosarum]
MVQLNAAERLFAVVTGEVLMPFSWPGLAPFVDRLNIGNDGLTLQRKIAPFHHVVGSELLATIKEFAHWHHLNEVTIAAGKTQSDSEID